MENKTYFSLSEKNADDYFYFRDKCNHYCGMHNGDSPGLFNERRMMSIRYDLYNNKVNTVHMKQVCKSFGKDFVNSAEDIGHKDILSSKIRSVVGLQMKRPFSYKAFTVNSEATTRKEQAVYDEVKRAVTDTVTAPIRKKLEQQYAGREDQGQAIEQEVARMTPLEVKVSMERDYQEPSEVMVSQLSEYLIHKLQLKRKMNNAFKHGVINARSVAYVGMFNGEPDVWVVNPMKFTPDMSSNSEFIEDGEYAVAEYNMSLSQIVKFFDMEREEVQRLMKSLPTRENGYDGTSLFRLMRQEGKFLEDNFYTGQEIIEDMNTFTVMHTVWKDFRDIRYLYYNDSKGTEQKMIVDDSYRLDKENGDIRIERDLLPETYETWKIMVSDPIYKNMRPVPGQFKDIDNLYNNKLPYYGIVHDNMNSAPVSLMDRGMNLQYYHNMLFWRFQKMLATDKGKKILMNLSLVPDGIKMDMSKWMNYVENSPYVFYDPTQNESGGYTDANTVAKVLDLSYAGELNKYVELMSYIRNEIGRVTGITDSIEGRTDYRESVRNAQTDLQNSSNTLEPYFELQDQFTKNVLHALLETAKIAYSGKGVLKLKYIVDDMTEKLLELDTALLDNTTIGLFFENNARTNEILTTIKNLAHASMQNDKINLSSVSAVFRQDSLIQAEEVLKKAEMEMFEQKKVLEKERSESEKQILEKQEEIDVKKHEREKELIRLKESERRITEIIKSGIMGASFNPDRDSDRDGINDFLENGRRDAELELKRQELLLDEKKFSHQSQTDNRKLDIEQQKAKQKS